jgi:hypothetical protein
MRSPLQPCTRGSKRGVNRGDGAGPPYPTDTRGLWLVNAAGTAMACLSMCIRMRHALQKKSIGSGASIFFISKVGKDTLQ